MITSLLVTMLTSPAFADAPQADPGLSHIVNGEQIGKAEFPAAVAIGFDIPQYGRQATCSASLLTPQLLLTAAHCTAEFGVPADQIIGVGAAFVGANVQGNKTEVLRFASITNHPRYGMDGQISNDVGIIELDQPYHGVDPVWYRDTELTASKAIGAEVVSVGYGITSSSNQGSGGVKRVATLTVDEISDQFLTSYAQTNEGRANVCSGDSGGPQYFVKKDGSIEQWAVHSYVFGGQDPCLVASGSTNVSTFAPFINKQIERVHGTLDKCEILDLYNNRVCDDVCDFPDEDCTMDEDGDGVVSDEEFAYFDSDGDGIVTPEEFANPGGCSTTGTAGFGFAPLLGLMALGLRRRQD